MSQQYIELALDDDDFKMRIRAQGTYINVTIADVREITGSETPNYFQVVFVCMSILSVCQFISNIFGIKSHWTLETSHVLSFGSV